MLFSHAHAQEAATRRTCLAEALALIRNDLWAEAASIMQRCGTKFGSATAAVACAVNVAFAFTFTFAFPVAFAFAFAEWKSKHATCAQKVLKAAQQTLREHSRRGALGRRQATGDGRQAAGASEQG